MEAAKKIEENVIEIPITKEMKKRQKELSDIYRENLDKYVWEGDKHMTDFCVKGVEWFVELPNGMIIPFEKHHIETRFCFGYSLSRYDSESFDNANEMARHAQESVTYFVRQNMKCYEWGEDALFGKGRFEYTWREPYLRVQYTGLPKDSNIRCLSFASGGIYGYEKYMNKKGQFVEIDRFIDYVPNDEEREIIAHGYAIAKQLHYKKVMAYLKRYGLSKVDTWTYWQDA